MPRLRRPRHPLHLLRQLGALVLVAAALVVAVRPPAPGTAGPAPGTPAVVAARDLPAGTVLAAADLTVADVPVGLRPLGAAGDPAELVDQVLAGPVQAGELVTRVRLVGPGLWSQVPAGEVAAPVRLADLAVAGLLRAGDRVDVLASAPADGGSGAVESEVVAPAALVLAVPTGEEGPVGVAGTGPSGLLVLAVPPSTAARLAAAAVTATLTVTVVRPSHDVPRLPP
ncbi:Flp pilus assembly protein CpaB [Modestobacter sp. I12A-02628]|uniref:Flp pilus assembly protein CpaB n=1 Tax=Goekera deserti TaxID=2497753 RepID=A0A7K3WGN2_9ACTN|nr:Flp pilus assembly protein CpaB [Goekera deserti]MPQ99387.1 Flp pilus assembly protein CpaB [Goekera deserti]NDI48874.1 Flp pilus assembly protein CpaB [Goekera deserti]NEL55655.1 Flp pilus assembly protein CpaB [Goekera deserti]